MGRKIRSFIAFIWRAASPAILYELVSAGSLAMLFLLLSMFALVMSFPLDVELLFSEFFLVISAAAAAVAVIPLGCIYCCWRETRQSEGRRPSRGVFTVIEMLRMGTLGSCLCILGNAVMIMLPVSWDSYDEISEAIYSPSVTVQLICIGLIMPVAEELVFRGLGYDRMRSKIAAFPAAVLSAAFFGLFHGNMVQFIYAGLLGFFLAGAMEWYGTLAAPYILHMSANMMSVVMSNTLLGGVIGAFASVRWAAIAACSLIAIVLIKRMRKDGSGSETLVNRDTVL